MSTNQHYVNKQTYWQWMPPSPFDDLPYTYVSISSKATNTSDNYYPQKSFQYSKNDSSTGINSGSQNSSCKLNFTDHVLIDSTN